MRRRNRLRCICFPHALPTYLRREFRRTRIVSEVLPAMPRRTRRSFGIVSVYCETSR